MPLLSPDDQERELALYLGRAVFIRHIGWGVCKCPVVEEVLVNETPAPVSDPEPVIENQIENIEEPVGDNNESGPDSANSGDDDISDVSAEEADVSIPLSFSSPISPAVFMHYEQEGVKDNVTYSSDDTLELPQYEGEGKNLYAFLCVAGFKCSALYGGLCGCRSCPQQIFIDQIDYSPGDGAKYLVVSVEHMTCVKLPWRAVGWLCQAVEVDPVLRAYMSTVIALDMTSMASFERDKNYLVFARLYSSYVRKKLASIRRVRKMEEELGLATPALPPDMCDKVVFGEVARQSGYYDEESWLGWPYKVPPHRVWTVRKRGW